MVEVSNIGDTGFLKARRPQHQGDAKWKDIEDLINRWAKRNPRGALLNENYIKSTREGLLDKKHGLMGGKADEKNNPSTRIGIAIHPELLAYIQAFYPKFMESKDDLREFKKRFPKFRVSESV